MKIISWNVNGIRSVLQKGFTDFLQTQDPDIICLQETKAQKDQVPVDFPAYTEFWNSAVKKGYSGTAIFTKIPPINVTFGMQDLDSGLQDSYGDTATEGRVITAEFEKFYLVTVYTPNSKPDLSRVMYRKDLWDVKFLQYCKTLEKLKPVIFCGDLNVAHMEIDLARPKENTRNAGFTNEERAGFNNIVSAGFVDTFRMFNSEGGNYTWWSNFAGARSRNVGWRIDYVCVSESIKNKVRNAFILPQVMGSDHCPVGVNIDL